MMLEQTIADYNILVLNFKMHIVKIKTTQMKEEDDKKKLIKDTQISWSLHMITFFLRVKVFV